MALFKILRGPKNALASKYKTITDGYAYFTPDDGAFYIDVKQENKETNEVFAEARVRINPDVRVIESVLSKNAWSDKKQVITIESYDPEYCHGTIGLSSAADLSEIEAATGADLYISNDFENGIEISCRGPREPQTDIPIRIILQEQIKGVAL